MALELFKEKWSDSIGVATIGVGEKQVKVGGQTTLPFLFQEGDIPHRPVIAIEIWDFPPEDWPEVLAGFFKKVWDNPVAWAKMCEEKYMADLICLKLQGAHPESA